MEIQEIERSDGPYKSDKDLMMDRQQSMEQSAMSHLQVEDPAAAHDKVKYVVDWAMNDCGCETPAMLVSLLTKMSMTANSPRQGLGRGGSMVDKLYHYAARSRAMRGAHGR